MYIFFLLEFNCFYLFKAKSAANSSLVLKATSEPVTLPWRNDHVTLEKLFVDEAIIISDMFNMNEIGAVELLTTAEQQMQYYPDLPRGLISVLLYYDARWALVNSLKLLVQARKGNSWTVETSDEITELITKYTDKLLAKGLVEEIVAQLTELNLEKENSLLQQNRALGGPKHRR